MICENILAFGFGPTEMIVIGIVGLLVFGNRLPSVGKSLGKGIIEFKKGLRGIEDDIEEATRPDTEEKPAEDK